MKSEIYNLIILDESGSMSGVKNQTISGCNETINTIRTAQKKFEDTQKHYVSIYAFQSNGSLPSRYIIKNVPVEEVEEITEKQYEPWGCTPLYDAVGGTLSDLKAVTRDSEMAIGSVTIITDGMENSSEHYTLGKVAKMIEALKELGWNFNFIGANIDVKKAAMSLNIDNSMEFQQDEIGTKAMFAKENRSRMGWLNRTSKVTASFCCASEGDKKKALDAYKAKLREASKGYFDDERGEDVD